MLYGLIDESGRLYDPNDGVLVFALVISDDLNNLEKIVLRTRERIPLKGKRKRERLSEIKFSLTGDKTRLFVLKELSQYRIKIFALIIDKQGRKIPDTPENYSFLIYTLLQKPIKTFPSLKHILIDKHFTFITQREQFNKHLHTKISKNVFIEHVDSLQTPVVTLADFVAGAIRYEYAKKEAQYRKIIKDLIIEEKFTSWIDLKRN